MSSMKNLKISENTHTKLKIYCAKNKFKIHVWVDDLIYKEIKKNERNNK